MIVRLLIRALLLLGLFTAGEGEVMAADAGAPSEILLGERREVRPQLNGQQIDAPLSQRNAELAGTAANLEDATALPYMRGRYERIDNFVGRFR